MWPSDSKWMWPLHEVSDELCGWKILAPVGWVIKLGKKLWQSNARVQQLREELQSLSSGMVSRNVTSWAVCLYFLEQVSFTNIVLTWVYIAQRIKKKTDLSEFGFTTVVWIWLNVSTCSVIAYHNNCGSSEGVAIIWRCQMQKEFWLLLCCNLLYMDCQFRLLWWDLKRGAYSGQSYLCAWLSHLWPL